MERNSFYETYEWKVLVANEKRNILARKLTPIQILMNVFELCMDNFDGNNLSIKFPVLYECLATLYKNNKETPLSYSLEENFLTISQLINTFEYNKITVKSVDCELFYAVLNFIDMLKTEEGKKIYYIIK